MNFFGYSIAVLVLIGGYTLHSQWHIVKPKLGVAKEFVFSALDSDYRDARQEIIAVIEHNTRENIVEISDYTRDLVHRYSEHNMDAEHDTYAFDKQTVTKKLWLSFQGKDKPHLSCGPRAYAMKDLLTGMNIKSRVVDIIQDETFNSHTFLEVYDPNTDRWHIQDPDFNVVYVNKNDNARLSAIDLIKNNSEEVAYQGISPESMTPNLTSLHELFNAVVIRESYDGMRNVLFYRANVFNIYSRNSRDDEMFIDALNRKYHQPILFPM